MRLLPKNSSPPTNTLTLPLNDVLYLPKCNVPVSVQGGLIFGFVFEEKSVMYQFPSNLSRVGGRGRGLALACVQGQEWACYRLKHHLNHANGEQLPQIWIITFVVIGEICFSQGNRMYEAMMFTMALPAMATITRANCYRKVRE